ncbi:putative L-2-hydroxyglutarate dehydrogenase, mitochondrial [Glarea lozoyensis 74030]|uniref:L-2-hydroxyglutarate dehydrogenase, mitochondrial n=1 Tax=Glarea lozoyensis (strain ATCC 74030 / MF5533) TaxID=1104152 RepID=H0EFI3_GLAL7|nr:putative L-2-hydroxyglutarate dehydrogenase, mitochondrial [Glarea lozoyensis 74030]
MFSRSLRGRFTSGILTRGFTSSASTQADFTHAVIGGGAVGLAIARRLAAREGTSTILIERNGAVGMETSSRNSEVIHAGLYYGADSLKTLLCVKGRQMMYALCEKYSIPHNNCGKWIVAQTEQQWEELTKLNKFTQTIEGTPTHFISIEEAARVEPYVKAKAGILASPTTGIIDSHSYMQFLLGDFEERGGDTALHSPVVRIEALGDHGTSGWEITTRDTSSGEESTFTSEVIINSAGLGACEINNMILPTSRHRTPYYAKGNYFSYAASTPRTKHLIYPAPEPGLGGLGTHLTLDIGGRIRFGPDVEWVDSPHDLAVNSERLPQAIEQIKKFMPDIQEDAIQPDYAGIRPKLGHNSAVASGKGFQDFIIQKEDGYEGFINLLGIESPGLTSSLAIGEMVDGLLYKS